jgi:hypothetical protein
MLLAAYFDCKGHFKFAEFSLSRDKYEESAHYENRLRICRASKSSTNGSPVRAKAKEMERNARYESGTRAASDTKGEAHP